MSTKIVVPSQFRSALQAQARKSRETLQTLDDGDTAIAAATAGLSDAMAEVAAQWPRNEAIPQPPSVVVVDPPAPLPPPHPIPAPTPPTPPNDDREVIGEQRPEGATFQLTSKVIRSDNCGILANKGRIDHMDIENVSIFSKQYGMWADSIGILGLHDVDMHVGGGVDPYGARLIAEEIDWRKVRIINNDGKGSLRITGTNEGVIRDLRTRGGQLWLGGGASDGAVNPMGFENVQVEHLEVLFDNPDAPGTPGAKTAIEFYKVINCMFDGALVILPAGLDKRVLSVWEKQCGNVVLRGWRVAEWSHNSNGDMVITTPVPLGWEHINNAAAVQAKRDEDGIPVLTIEP